MSDRKQEFWDRLEGVNAGMTGLESDLRFLPMSHNADAKAGRLWFISAKGQHLVDACETGPQEALHIVTDSGIHANIRGTLSLSNDAAKLDEIWNAVASSWFEDGKRDPDIRLLEFTPAQAEVWLTPGGLGFLFQIAKSKVTGDKPDMGETFTLTF